uniref:Uncharacterized protein n=1 Tax=Ascaris lumbricoides TaxID=6252 RepID=A0A0M3HPI1_ASCLU
MPRRTTNTVFPKFINLNDVLNCNLLSKAQAYNPECSQQTTREWSIRLIPLLANYLGIPFMYGHKKYFFIDHLQLFFMCMEEANHRLDQLTAVIEVILAPVERMLLTQLMVWLEEMKLHAATIDKCQLIANSQIFLNR